MTARLDNAGLRALLNSPNWREFERSVAEGLHVSLGVYRGSERILAAGGGCPCEYGGGGSECTGYLPRSLVAVGEPVVVRCEGGVPRAICHLAGEQILEVIYLGPVAGVPPVPGKGMALPEIGVEELQGKARTARTIIAGFVMAYFAATAWGRRGLEMAAIQEISHTVVSLLGFSSPAQDKALDLILNCAMVLLDADGCWLVTSGGLVMTRGEVGDLPSLLGGEGRLPHGVLEQPIGYAGEWGRLGVLYPAERQWATEVLNQLANQAQIALEVDRLLRVTQHQVGMVLEAMDSAVLILDRSGRISFANGSAERLLARRRADLFGWEAGVALQGLAEGVRDTLILGHHFRGLGQTGAAAGNLRVEWSTGPLWDGGEIAGCLAVVRSRIGPVREIQAPLMAARDLLARAIPAAADKVLDDLRRADAEMEQALRVLAGHAQRAWGDDQG